MTDVNDLILWLHSDNEAVPSSLLDATPSSDELEVLELCLAATEACINANYTLPATPGEDIRLATMMQAARLYRRRATPEGIFAVGDFGPFRVSALDPDIAALLQPYKVYHLA